jgi:hypothetical protein
MLASLCALCCVLAFTDPGRRELREREKEREEERKKQ